MRNAWGGGRWGRGGGTGGGGGGKLLVCKINDKCYLNKEDIKIIKIEKESFVTT